MFHCSVEEKDINQVIDMMFREAGIQEKPQITFDDFSRILRDHEQYLDCAQLNFGESARCHSNGTVNAEWIRDWVFGWLQAWLSHHLRPTLRLALKP